MDEESNLFLENYLALERPHVYVLMVLHEEFSAISEKLLVQSQAKDIHPSQSIALLATAQAMHNTSSQILKKLEEVKDIKPNRK